MFQNLLVCILIYFVSVLLAISLGRYMNKVYKGRKSMLDFLAPFENLIFRICRINPTMEMNWKQYLIAMLVSNLVWLCFGFIILFIQGGLFLNPAHIASMDWSLGLNSAISFLTSTDLQHYSGETGATYLSQLSVFMFLQFLSAATSLSIGVAVVRGLVTKTRSSLGNFYQDLIRSLIRILLPLCIIAAILFLINGVPMMFRGPQQIVSLHADNITVATGPVAAFLPIKELGSNGGGFFGANNAHPFENPNFFTFVLHCVIVFLLPMAFVFFIGYYLKAQKFAKMIFAVMTLGFLLFTIPIIRQEIDDNSKLAAMGIQAKGNMEGKEVRIGPFYSAFYCGENVAIPAGTVVGVHDSFMPLSGAFMLLSMNIDCFFGGLGTGWINIFIFLIIALFLGSLMIGRTPELLGKKIDMREMQITVGVVVLQSMVPMILAGIACYTYVHYEGGNSSLNWLSNRGPHGFTTMLYEYISSYAGNGSNFAGLGNNTVFWNVTTSIAMISGRFLPMAGVLWIAGLLIQKKYTPRSSGTIKIQGVTFAIFLLAVILVLNVISLFPALMVGPISDHFLLK